MSEHHDTAEARLMRFFLRRTRRLAIFDLYADAQRRGVLEAERIDDDRTFGAVWRASATIEERLTGNSAQDQRTVARLMRSSSGAGTDRDKYVAWSEAPSSSNEQEAENSKARAIRCAASSRGEGIDVEPTRYLLPIIRSCLPPPDVSKVAIALLVARAVAESGHTLSVLTTALAHPRPTVLIKAPVGGFEKHFTASLEEGLITPFWATLLDLLNSLAYIDRYGELRSGRKRRKLVFGSGRAIAKAKEVEVRRRIARAISVEEVPLIIADERAAALNDSVVSTVDLVLECSGLDEGLLIELLYLCAGVSRETSSVEIRGRQLELSGLHLDDLAMAIRPGRGVAAILFALETLLKPCIDDETLAEGERDETKKRKSGATAKLTHTVEIVRPEPLETSAPQTAGGSAVHTSTAVKPRLQVETLAGYGDAKTWALELKQDLEDWRAEAIEWEDMSSKLLLSGPPGTGKTTFARALCNSLQVPLVVSSVTSWLEPGYLGEVLQRMSAAFTSAREHAPCIMLIDEIDGIGSRSGEGGTGRQYDDYWTSLINRLLELLDGALKTEGVIVVAATNYPGKVDAALRRSGRLEKHVAIPLPDVAALMEILAHHLGADLPDVVSSARHSNSAVRLRPPPARNGVPLKRRGSAPSSSNSQKGPHHE